MNTPSNSQTEQKSKQSSEREIEIYDSCPARSVFIEGDNTDGWISTDLTVEVTR